MSGNSGKTGLPEHSEIRAMRAEAIGRAALLCLVASIIPSLILASTWPDHLHDLIVPLGAPVSHILHAVMVYAALLGALLAAAALRDRRVAATGRRVSKPVAAVAEELGQSTGVTTDVRGYGGLLENGIEAASAGFRRIIWIGTLRERQCVVDPSRFRFAFAHELAHIASGDPVTERIVGTAYLTGALFIVAGIGRVILAVVGDPLSLMHRGFEAVVFAFRAALPALLPNLLAFGVLSALLFAESRSARRLREFHADAFAREVTGNDQAIAVSQREPTETTSILARYRATHPLTEDRAKALKALGVAWNADQNLFVLQAYFAATVLEVTFQLLFVNLSAGATTSAERATHFAGQLGRYPVTVLLVLAVAAALIMLAQHIVLGRFAMIAEDQQKSGLNPLVFARTAGLVGLGAFLALASSQSTYWNLTLANWNALRWVEVMSDELILHTLLFLASSASLTLTLGLGQAARIRRFRAVLAALPVVNLFAAGTWLYLR